MNFELGRSANSAPSYFYVVARVQTLFALLVCTWAIGGYYPFARFATIALLALASGFFWLDPLRSSAAIAGSKVPILLLLSVVLLGAGQIFATSAAVETGAQQIRSEFAATAEPIVQFTIFTWQTKSWLSMFAIGVAGFFLSAALFNTEKSRVALLAGVAAIGASQVMWGLIQTIRLPESIVPGLLNPGGSTPFGSFLNRNHGADFIGMALVSTIGLLCWFYRRDVRSRIGAYQNNSMRETVQSPVGILLWVGLVWLSLGLVVSFSRGAWLSFAIALAMTYASWKQGYKARSWVMVIMVAIISMSAGLGVQVLGLEDRLERRLDKFEMETALTNERLVHWQEAFPAVQHYLPYGSGLGTYSYAYLPFEPVPQNGWFTHAHNQYLEVAMEAGIPGIIILLTGMWLSMVTCLKLCRSDRSASEQGLGVAALGAMVMQAAHAITDFGLMMPANLLTLSMLVGAAVGAGPHWGMRIATRSDHVWSVCISSVVTVVIAASVWHQMACVRADRLEAITQFSAATPAPDHEQASVWIRQVEDELSRSPDNEQMLQRLIQLRLHRAHRVRYDRLAQSSKTHNAIWDYTSLNGLIARAYSDETLTDELVAEQQASLAADPDIRLAIGELQRSLSLNPVQPATHFRLAQIYAATGKPWEEAFAKSVRLSVVDPRMSLGNGLLAWAMGDQKSMIQQWKQTLALDPAHAPMIFRLARQSLNSDRLVDDLMPDRWVVPYHLGVMVKKQDHQLSEKLLNKADAVAESTLPDEARRVRARAVIAIAQQDFHKAAELLAQAVIAFPKDADLRYQYASALLRSDDLKAAADQARVAVNLKPGSKLYNQLFERAKALHQQQSVRD